MRIQRTLERSPSLTLRVNFFLPIALVADLERALWKESECSTSQQRTDLEAVGSLSVRLVGWRSHRRIVRIRKTFRVTRPLRRTSKTDLFTLAIRRGFVGEHRFAMRLYRSTRQPRRASGRSNPVTGLSCCHRNWVSR